MSTLLFFWFFGIHDYMRYRKRKIFPRWYFWLDKLSIKYLNNQDKILIRTFKYSIYIVIAFIAGRVGNFILYHVILGEPVLTPIHIKTFVNLLPS